MYEKAGGKNDDLSFEINCFTAEKVADHFVRTSTGFHLEFFPKDISQEGGPGVS